MNNIMLYFNFENKVYEYHLPAINNRRLVLDLSRLGAENNCELEFEIWDNVWFVRTTKEIRLREQEKNQELFELKIGTVLNGIIETTRENFSILVMEQDQEVTTYQKYYIKDREQIEIGKKSGIDITIDNEYVSKIHAVIYRSNQEIYIKDNSKNGTFVNNERLLNTRKLELFDEIYIIGVKLVFLGDILAVNHRGMVSCQLPPAHLHDIQQKTELIQSAYQERGHFSRAPRVIEPLDREPVEIEGPPGAQREKKQPLLFILGPSVTMPIPIMMSVLFNMNMSSTGSNPFLYLGTLMSVLSSALIGAGWAMAHQRFNGKQGKEEERLRVESYRKYIEHNEELLKEKHDYNKQILENQYLSTQRLCQIPDADRFLLWNRNVNHEDFLTIRLGRGKVLFPAEISIPKERFSLWEDELSELPHELWRKYHFIMDAVSGIDLKENKLIGVIGENAEILSIMKTMVIQIAALHCYTEVKMAFLTNESNEGKMDWIKWLPHFFSQDKKIRYIADSEMTRQNVLYELSEELRSRQEKLEEDNAKAHFDTHYIVFCTEAELIEKEAIYSYMVSEQNYGFTFVLLYGKLDRLPNECVRILQFDKSYEGNYLLTETKNEANAISFDKVSDDEAEHFARALSGIYVNETAGGEIPASIDFMEMMQIPRLEQWDLMKRYKENRVYEGIKAMVGLTYGNRPMYLDIHEKKFGPHGLVAGTTGSGKSETLMTFILSLAMNYHPDEVAFVLIDYKGGGMAASFTGLPHLAGTITNIGGGDETEGVDENQTRRALISIRSEIRRRQKLFGKYKVNHIDSYIRLYREGETKEALPHLIIISDEFAELKKEQPEFIKELVSTARVGRSLGIHLILATQKPGGVVDDEIWSNSRFKICLRVQDKQDSIGMLKRPEAAYITGIGRAYLQIGNDEVFEMFQSGYAGAMYEPKDTMELSQHSEVSMIGLDGRKLVTPVRKVSSSTISQLDACVQYIRKTTQENQVKAVRPLWLPPLPDRISLEEISEHYPVDLTDGIKAVIGFVDDPKLQRQFPAVLDLLSVANIMIVGNIGRGKTTLIQTMLYSLVTQYGAQQLNLYCMDFSSRTFRMFNMLPHCGGVALSEEEEAIERMLRLLLDMAEERKLLFEQTGVGSYTEYLNMAGLPLALLVIDNYMMFKELYPDHEEKVALLLREGFKYGIQIIIASNAPGDMNYRMRQNITKVIPLYMGEKSRYMDVFNGSVDLVPGNIQGRGLWEADRIMEFQTALAVAGENELERNRLIQQKFKEIAAAAGVDGNATRVRTIPKQETYAEFLEKTDRPDILPLGYNEQDLKIEGIDLSEAYCYAVSFSSGKSIPLFMSNLKTFGEKWGYRMIHVGNGRDVKPDSYEELYAFAKELRSQFKQRSDYRKQLPEETTAREAWKAVTGQFGKMMILVDDLQEFLEAVYQDQEDRENMDGLFEVFFRKGKGLGICFFGAVSPAAHYNVRGKMAGEYFLQYQQGIHFGGRLDAQKLFDFNVPLSKQMKPLDHNIGSWMEDEVYKQIFMPFSKREES